VEDKTMQEIPAGIWNIASYAVALAIPFLFLALAFNSMGILKITGKKVEQSEKEEKAFGETAKRGGRGLGSVGILMAGFVFTLLLIMPRRVEVFNFLIVLFNGLMALANVSLRLPLLETL
jgi:hypothetical protein